MSAFDKVVLVGLVVILLPVLITPAGWAFALLLGIGWIAVTYGGRYLLDLEKQRRQGERGMAHDVRQRARRGDER